MPALDPHARFKALIDSWCMQALAEQLRAADQPSGRSNSRNDPLWHCIKRAKSTGSDSHWITAMSHLAQASLDNKRPIMLASTALVSILSDGHDIPFEALRALVKPILFEQAIGSPGYDWGRNFPVDRSEQAWLMAVGAAALLDPAP